MLKNRHRDYLDRLPSDWEQVPIDALGEIASGGTPSRTVPSFWDGSIPWVTPGELTKLPDKRLAKTRERITESGLAASAAKLLPRNSLLVTTRATIGEVAIADFAVTTNQGFKNLVPNASADSTFYYYIFKRIASELSRLASGSTFDEISRRDFARILVPRPPLPEQRRIADILDTLDTAIQQTETLIAKLKQVKAGLFHDLLTRGLDEHGQLRDPVAHPEQFKESDLGLIPISWSVIRLRDVTSVQNGTTPAREQPAYWIEGTIPWRLCPRRIPLANPVGA